MMELICDLVSTCKPSKLTRAQRDHAKSLMVELRSLGFSLRELHVLGKIPEPTIKKWIRNMPVKDTSEHDRVIALLGDFAQSGGDLDDLEYYKEAKGALGGQLSFKDCAKLVKDLDAVGADITGLCMLSEELAGRGLLVPAIEKNMALNKNLAEKGLTPEIQEHLLNVALKYGDADKIFKVLDVYGGIQPLLNLKTKVEEDVQIALDKEAESKKKKDTLDAQALVQKTYLDIVKLLVADYSYDYSSLKNLHELAAKYGDSLQVMGAVNVYGDMLDLKKQAASEANNVDEKKRELEIVERKIKEANTEYKKLFELNAEANQILGEIIANEKTSRRLQTISSLLLDAQKTSSTPEELSRISVAVLTGVAECVKANPDFPDGFKKIVKNEVEIAIMKLNLYLRGF